MRKCGKCEQEKDEKEFYKDRSKKDGLAYWCKLCHSNYNKKQWIKNKTKLSKYRRGWDRRDYNYARNRKIKEKVFKYYGDKCICCEENNIEMLTIDHINNNGADHRKKTGCRTGSNFYAWLVKNNYPEGFQTLCFNCNISKYINDGVCSHVKN
jgi:hypothetical protein